MNFPFKNRSEAGARLGEKLKSIKFGNAAVLAIPRGGVPIGYEISSRLNLPLDTLVARKIGAPMNEEYGIGAVAPGSIIILNDAELKEAGVTREGLDPLIGAALKEMDRRVDVYQSGEYIRDGRLDLVIIVDDGLATGLTAEAAIESAKINLRAKEIIFAVPVCPPATLTKIENLVREVVCLEKVENLVAIGAAYEDFMQISDAEVLSYLERANSAN